MRELVLSENRFDQNRNTPMVNGKCITKRRENTVVNHATKVFNIHFLIVRAVCCKVIVQYHCMEVW